MPKKLNVGDSVTFKVNNPRVNGRTEGMVIESTVRIVVHGCFYVEGEKYGFYFGDVCFLKNQEEESPKQEEVKDWEEEYPFYTTYDILLEQEGCKQRWHEFEKKVTKNVVYCAKCGRDETQCMYSPKYKQINNGKTRRS